MSERYNRYTFCRIFIAPALTVLLVFLSVAGFGQCPDQQDTLFSRWNIPTIVCADSTYTFTIGYDTTNKDIVIKPQEAKIDSAKQMFVSESSTSGTCNEDCTNYSPISYSGYSGNISSANDIKYIRLNIEHACIQDLNIKISCDNGQKKASILNHSGQTILVNGNCDRSEITSGWTSNPSQIPLKFGYQNPNDANNSYCDSSQNTPGTGYNYCWSCRNDNSIDYAGKIYDDSNYDNQQRIITASNTTGALTQIYRPDGDFEELIDCPISGTWKIEIFDGWANHKNGYLFDWEIRFADGVLNPDGKTIDSVAVLTEDGQFSQDFQPVRFSDSTLYFTAPSVSHDSSITYILRLLEPSGRCYDTPFTIRVKPKPTIILNPCGGICESESLTLDCDAGAVLPGATPCAEGWTFAGWSETIVHPGDNIDAAGLFPSEYLFWPTVDTTRLYAVYTECDSNYKKVTEPRTDWSGNYLIVHCDDDNSVFVFNGSDHSDEPLNHNNNYVLKNLINNTLPYNHKAYSFTISPAPIANTYFIKSASGFYIGKTSCNDNEINVYSQSDDNVVNNISFTNTDNIFIEGICANRHLQFYNSGNNKLFRYYSNSYNPIQLFRLETENCDYASYPPPPSRDTFAIACSNYEWRGQTCDHTGDYADTFRVDGCDSVVNLHLTVLNENSHTVTFKPGDGGTCNTLSLTEDTCFSGVTLPEATPCHSDFEFVGWTTNVIATPDSTSVSNFSLPLYPAGAPYNPTADTTLYAVYKRKSCSIDTNFILVTEDLTDNSTGWNGEYLIACNQYNTVFNGGSGISNSLNVSITNGTISLSDNSNIETCIFYITWLGGDYYSLKSKNNSWYIGGIPNHIGVGTSSTSNTAFFNTIEYSNGNVSITSNGSEFRGIGSRYCYYPSDNPNGYPIQLYRLELGGTCYLWTDVPKPTVTISGDTTFCEGDSTQLTASIGDGYENVSYSWNTGATNSSISASSAGRYTVTVNIGGCEVEESVEVVENPSYEVDDTHTMCQGESWTWEGHTFGSEAGTFPVTDTIPAQAGCDSIVHMTVTVNPAYEVDDEMAVCEGAMPYTWNGVTFTGTGTQSVTLTAGNGCDSVVTMTLTVNESYDVTDELAVCPAALPYSWNGIEFTEAGIQTVTFTAVNGCDSVVTLTLTVSETYEVTDELAVCPAALPYSWNGIEFTGAGTQSVTLTDGNGCDSVVTMTLTVNEGYEVTDEMAVCAGDLPYTWNGVTFTGAGTQSVTLTAAHQCDSVVTMTLTVHPTPELSLSSDNIMLCQGAEMDNVTVTSSYVNVTVLGLPQGVTFVDGNIGGTPTESGTFNATVTITSDQNCSSSTQLTLTVHPPVTISTSTMEICPLDSVTVAASFQNVPTTDYTVTWTADHNDDATHQNSIDPLLLTDTFDIDIPDNFTDATLYYTVQFQYSDGACQISKRDSIIVMSWTLSAEFMESDTIEITCLSDTLNNPITPPIYTYQCGDALIVIADNTAPEWDIQNDGHGTITYYYTYNNIYGSDPHPWTFVYNVIPDFNPPENQETIVHSISEVPDNGPSSNLLPEITNCNQNIPLILSGTENNLTSISIDDAYILIYGDTISHNNHDTVYFYVYGDQAHAPGEITYEDRNDTTFVYVYDTNTFSFEEDDLVYGDITFVYSYQITRSTWTYTYHIVPDVIQGYDMQTVCSEDLPFNWLNGDSYNESTSTPAVNGILVYNGISMGLNITLNLNVNKPVNISLTDTACNPYTWIRVDGSTETYVASGEYTYAHVDANRCTQVDTLYLTYVDTTNTYITAGDFCNDFSAMLEVRSDFTNFTSFLWSTGETTSTITVYNEDTYTVTATQGSCSLERNYTIEPCELDILLPNAISPLSNNPDNQAFSIPEYYLNSIDDNNFSIYIYNRWGALVFSSTSKDFKWDGTVNNRIFHEQFYNYIIRYRNTSGQARKVSGSVLVL